MAAAGLSVEPYHKHFALDNVPDREWLQFVGERGWIALSHNKHIRYERDELDDLMIHDDEPFAAKVYQGRKDVDLWVTYRQWQEARRLRRW